MLLFLKKKDRNTARVDQLPAADATAASDFIPYHSHYNPHTLLTKNGELVQIVRIASNLRGLDYESGDGNDSILREIIRRAILETVRTDKLALWIHTIRKRKPIHHRGTFKEAFAAYVHDRWKQRYRWKHQYYNEIYVSLLYEGQSSALFDKENLAHVLLPKRHREFRHAYLDVAYAELDGTVSALIEKIGQHYQAQRLSIVERVPAQMDSVDSPSPLHRAIFYSEPMEFLGSLANLRSEHFPLPEADVSAALCTTTRLFGFNALETRNEAGKRRFGAVLTLKQYREVPPDTADRLLQAPMEFVISQSFHFIPSAGALMQYKEQKDIFDISGDLWCNQASGIEDMMASQGDLTTDFGEHQVSIMVMADEFKQLDGEIAKVQAAFSELGLITIREDLRLEECFWAQLPGNFEFIRRPDTINTTRIGGFCRLNRFPNGTADGNHWGDAVTLLPTMVGSPYFFNFHHQDNGHTAVFDFNSFHDHAGSVLLNFLLSETRKYDGRLYIFDRDQSARLFFDKLGGDYHTFPALSGNADEPRLHLNPFTLEDTPRNRSFLLAWCGALLGPEVTQTDHHKDILRTAIDHLYGEAPENRHLAGLADHAAASDVTLARSLARWHTNGVLAGLFDAPEEDFDLRHRLHAFDMTPVLRQPECIIPVFAYLMHRVIMALDGRPTIIVLHEAWDLLENAFFAPRLESLLEMLQQNNAMVIFTFGKPAGCSGAHSFGTVMAHCATHITIPDDIVHPYASHNIGLDANDEKLLLRMERQRGDFLLKQNNETIALRADIKEMDTICAVLANDSKNLAAALDKFTGIQPADGE